MSVSWGLMILPIESGTGLNKGNQLRPAQFRLCFTNFCSGIFCFDSIEPTRMLALWFFLSCFPLILESRGNTSDLSRLITTNESPWAC